MRNIYKLDRSNLWSRILVLWLIFAIFVLLLSSCANTRSVRNSVFSSQKKVKLENNPKIIKEDNKVDSVENIVMPELEEFADKAIKNNNLPVDNNQLLAEYNKNHARIPTLREQMKALADEQQSMSNNITNLKSDIVEIKQTLTQIKDVIDDLEIPNKAVYRGPNNANNNIKTDNQNLTNDTYNETYIVSSDEDYENEDETNMDEPIIDKPKAKKEIKKPVVKKVISPKVEKVQAPVQIKAPEIKVEKSTNINEDYELALKLYADKNYSQAIDKFKNTLTKTKEANVVSDCNYFTGECYFALKDYDNALLHFNKTISAGNGNKKDNAQLMIAEANVRTGKVTEAKSAYQNLIKFYPESELIAKAKKMLQQL